MSNGAVLKTTVSLNGEGLLNVVLTSADLPTLPTVASKLVTLTSATETTLSEVAELVSQDVALSSKILKVANSAFYSFPQQIGSIQQAISMLGTNAVQSLVLSFSLLSIKKGSDETQFDFDKFWERSLSAGVGAKLILSKVPGANTEEIFVSALLQNLGQLVLASTLPKEYDKVIEKLSGEDEYTDAQERAAEAEVFGSDHCYIGYEVSKHWNFPLSISLPILHHHEPESYSGDDEKIRLTTAAIYLSDLLLNIFHSNRPEEYYGRFKDEARKLLKLDTAVIDSLLEEAHIELDEGAANFGIKMETARPVQEILQEANIRLSLLNLDYDQVNKELVKAKVALEKLTAELQEKNLQLKNLADRDGLTGIYNNRYFQTALDRELNRTLRRKYELSLLMIDIDQFKKFNDEHGHLLGDFILAEFSKMLSESLREYDTLARYGGEEFVVILPETSTDDALRVAEKLCKAVANHAFKEEGKTYHVTASFGVSTRSGEQETGPGKMELIRLADQALYEAKKKGRNQVCVHSSEKKGWFKR